jgi:hypothetical protein
MVLMGFMVLANLVDSYNNGCKYSEMTLEDVRVKDRLGGEIAVIDTPTPGIETINTEGK